MTQNRISNFVIPAMLRGRDSNMDGQDRQDGKRLVGFDSTYHVHPVYPCSKIHVLVPAMPGYGKAE